MREIPLTQGKITLVDDDDYDELSKHKWHVEKIGRIWYAVRAGKKPNGKLVMIRMHRQLMGFPDSFVDHKDGDGLNNQRSNLRLANNRQNQWNAHKRPGLSSQFKGVCWDKNAGKWLAQIRQDKEPRYLGRFHSERQAALAYDAAARRLFGEFACLNFPDLELKSDDGKE